MTNRTFIILIILSLGLASCSTSSRDDSLEPRTGENTELPDPVLTCAAYAVEAGGNDAAFEVKASFGVPPYYINSVNYDTEPAGTEELSFVDENASFNSTNRVYINEVASGTEAVFGDVGVVDSVGSTATCSFDLDLSGTSGSSAIEDNCQVLFSQNPTYSGRLVYLTVVPTQAFGWYWLRNVTSGPGFFYGGSPDGVVGKIGFASGGVFTLQAEVEDSATGDRGTCTGTQWVFY